MPCENSPTALRSNLTTMSDPRNCRTNQTKHFFFEKRSITFGSVLIIQRRRSVKFYACTVAKPTHLKFQCRFVHANITSIKEIHNGSDAVQVTSFVNRTDFFGDKSELNRLRSFYFRMDSKFTIGSKENQIDAPCMRGLWESDSKRSKNIYSRISAGHLLTYRC